MTGGACEMAGALLLMTLCNPGRVAQAVARGDWGALHAWLHPAVAQFIRSRHEKGLLYTAYMH